MGATIALALLVGGAYLVGSGATTQTPVAAALPSASSTPVASSPTPGPSASPISEAAAFYDALYAFDRASLQPCFAGGTSCDTAASVDYGDGVARTLGPEVIRLYELFRDNASPQFTATVCREERCAFFAYLAWLRGEVEVVGRTDAAGRAPQPVQRKPLRFEGCAKTTYDDLKARARELSTVLVSAQEVIASASDHLPDGDAATLAADGERLVTVGLDLARRAARDASFADVSAGAPEWVAMRAAAGDMVLAGMLLRDPSTATATSTKTLLRDVAAALEPVLKADPVRNWH